ncbi:MAG: hypothetical protein M0Q95_09950 [Porticoccaceae bacterium]|nr:hypothetical protein [Porticoccaceae bacterium]
MKAKYRALGAVKTLLVFTYLLLGSALLLPHGSYDSSQPAAESHSKTLAGFFENREIVASAASQQNVGDDDPALRSFELQQLVLSGVLFTATLWLTVVFTNPFNGANGIRAPPSSSLLTV